MMGDRDSGLEIAMRRLHLSSAEKKGIKICMEKGLAVKDDDWHVVGKALSNKPVSVQGIQRTLGWIWCADKGMVCKDAGDNKFLFSFNHSTAKKRALEDGPWMVGHSLMVMVPYDRRKELEALQFTYVPIWIRIFKLPMGMMNRSVAEIIGNEIGSFMDVDVEENGTAAGCYLRIKVRIDIRNPIMRGVTLDIEEEDGKERWCPFQYEFLPEFCHCCGIIGHIDKNYSVSIPLADRQYGNWLRVLPPKRRFSDEICRPNFGGKSLQYNSRSSGDWKRDKEVRLTEKGNEGTKERGEGREKSGMANGGKIGSDNEKLLATESTRQARDSCKHNEEVNHSGDRDHCGQKRKSVALLRKLTGRLVILQVTLSNK